MRELIWLPDAKADLQRLYDFIEPHSSSAAARAIQTMIATADTLREFPHKGRPWPPDPTFRELSIAFGARGYVLRYREHDQRIIIVRIWHALEDR